MNKMEKKEKIKGFVTKRKGKRKERERNGGGNGGKE